MTDKSWADMFRAYSVLSLSEVGRSNADHRAQWGRRERPCQMRTRFFLYNSLLPFVKPNEKCSSHYFLLFSLFQKPIKCSGQIVFWSRTALYNKRWFWIQLRCTEFECFSALALVCLIMWPCIWVFFCPSFGEPVYQGFITKIHKPGGQDSRWKTVLL